MYNDNRAEAGSSPAPAVGIFWRVGRVLVVDRSTLDEAEVYGDCLTHPAGHYDRWQDWQAQGVEQLVTAGYPTEISWTEYDEWPRGRIVYETTARRYVIYADRRLQTADTIDALKAAFGLTQAEVMIRSDAHYR